MTLPNKDLRQVYHVACTIGEVDSRGYLETRLSKLCTSSRINQFSKWKPVHYKGSEINLSILQSLKYGLAITSAHTADELIAAIDSQGTHTYNRPLGGVNSPYRLGDFRNYDPSALMPAIPLGEQDIKNGGGNATTKLIGLLNPETSTSVGYENFYPTSLYRGIYMINANGHKQWCTDEIRWENIPNKSYWQTGTITCYDFYTNVKKTINGAYYPNQSDMFYAVTGSLTNPNPYKWHLTGQRPPDSDLFYFHVLAVLSTDATYVDYKVTMSSVGDVYRGGTANNIQLALTDQKNGAYNINSTVIASSYTIGAEAEKVWSGSLQVPAPYRNRPIYVQLFANSQKQFESPVAIMDPGRQ